MTSIDLLLTAALGLLAGGSIGCVGVGGVIVVPVLVQVVGMPVHTAIAVAMAGYIPTGLVGAAVYLRKGTLDWRRARYLCLGAIPAAIGGSLAASAASAVVLEMIIAALALSSGVQTLVRGAGRSASPQDVDLSPGKSLGLGVVTGVLSALTGTGGPAVLIPMLLTLGLPVLATIGLGQAVQFPIALVATLSNIAHGTYDLVASVLLGAGLTLGAWFGARLAHSLDQSKLRIVVAVVLLLVGLWLLIKAIRDLV